MPAVVRLRPAGNSASSSKSIGDKGRASVSDLVVCTWCARTAGKWMARDGPADTLPPPDLRKRSRAIHGGSRWHGLEALTPRVSSVQVRPGPQAERGLRRMRCPFWRRPWRVTLAAARHHKRESDLRQIAEPSGSAGPESPLGAGVAE